MYNVHLLGVHVSVDVDVCTLSALDCHLPVDVADVIGRVRPLKAAVVTLCCVYGSIVYACNISNVI